MSNDFSVPDEIIEAAHKVHNFIDEHSLNGDAIICGLTTVKYARNQYNEGFKEGGIMKSNGY